MPRPRRVRRLFEGKRVIVDASFRDESQRVRFLDLAAQWSVPGLFLICQADAAVVKTRLETAGTMSRMPTGRSIFTPPGNGTRWAHDRSNSVTRSTLARTIPSRSSQRSTCFEIGELWI